MASTRKSTVAWADMDSSSSEEDGNDDRDDDEVEEEEEEATTSGRGHTQSERKWHRKSSSVDVPQSRWKRSSTRDRDGENENDVSRVTVNKNTTVDNNGASTRSVPYRIRTTVVTIKTAVTTTNKSSTESYNSDDSRKELDRRPNRYTQHQHHQQHSSWRRNANGDGRLDG